MKKFEVKRVVTSTAEVQALTAEEAVELAESQNAISWKLKNITLSAIDKEGAIE
jgi:hypothetical protein